MTDCGTGYSYTYYYSDCSLHLYISSTAHGSLLYFLKRSVVVKVENELRSRQLERRSLITLIMSQLLVPTGQLLRLESRHMTRAGFPRLLVNVLNQRDPNQRPPKPDMSLWAGRTLMKGLRRRRMYLPSCRRCGSKVL